MEFIDLDRQYEVIRRSLERRLKGVIDRKHFIMGEEVRELEDALAGYTGRKYAFSCSSGTDALVIPLMAWGVGPGDAVFVPAFTFFASAESVSLTGATPVFVDVDEWFNIDVRHLRQVIKETLAKGKLKPRGIISVDLFGLPADYDGLKEMADRYGLFLLEDAAQGFGGAYHGKRSGSLGDVSATSFFPAKPLGGYGDGGAIFTDDGRMAELIRSIRVHGQGSSRYDNVRIGLNGRLDTIQAAVLLSKLEVFDAELAAREKVAQGYTRRLKPYYQTPSVPEGCVSAWAQYTVLARDNRQRERIVTELPKLDIPIMVYYAIPMHLQTAYRELGYHKGDLPVAEDYSGRVFSLPMHPYLTDEEMDTICRELIQIAETM